MVPTIDVLTNDTPFAIGTAKDMSRNNVNNIYVCICILGTFISMKVSVFHCFT